MITISAVNLAHKLVLMSDGSVLPVVHMFDGNGEETSDPGAALAFVATDGIHSVSAPTDFYMSFTVH